MSKTDNKFEQISYEKLEYSYNSGCHAVFQSFFLRFSIKYLILIFNDRGMPSSKMWERGKGVR